MTSKSDSRWLPSFEKARGRVLIDKLMAGGGGSGEWASSGETNGSTEAGSAAGGAAAGLRRESSMIHNTIVE